MLIGILIGIPMMGGLGDTTPPAPGAGIAIVLEGTLTAIVLEGTLTAIVLE